CVLLCCVCMDKRERDDDNLVLLGHSPLLLFIFFLFLLFIYSLSSTALPNSLSLPLLTSLLFLNNNLLLYLHYFYK
ncbi:hypothetical protein VIGAN_11030400, partial [Vigna angularis var. angularis]